MKKIRNPPVLLAIFVMVAVTFVTASTPASAGNPTPTPTACPYGLCRGNWDRVCAFDGDNFTRHDTLSSEILIGDLQHNSVYELSWEGSEGAFSDGIIRIVAMIGKGQVRFLNGFTTNGYCYFGSKSQIEAYLTSGQAGHVRGLQYCTDLTADYIPVISVDPMTGNVTVLVEGKKGPSVAEIQRHLVPLATVVPTATTLAPQSTAVPPTSPAPTATQDVMATDVAQYNATIDAKMTEVAAQLTKSAEDVKKTMSAMSTDIARYEATHSAQLTAAAATSTPTTTVAPKPTKEPGDGIFGGVARFAFDFRASWPVWLLILGLIAAVILLAIFRRRTAP